MLFYNNDERILDIPLFHVKHIKKIPFSFSCDYCESLALLRPDAVLESRQE